MEPKSISFSAGAAALIYNFIFPDQPIHELGTVEGITTAGFIWSALTAVITPFADGPGRAILTRITAAIYGKQNDE